MHVTIRYQYEDRRKTGPLYLTGHVILELTSVSDQEAPVLLCSRRNFGKPSLPGTPQSVALRSHGGRIWTPGPVFDGIPICANPSMPWRYLLPSGFSSTGVMGSRVELPDGDSLHVAKNRQSIESAFREWAADCLVIEDQLHRATLLPQYVVRPYTDRVEVNLTSVGMPLEPTDRAFQATELEAARSHAQVLSTRHGYDLSPELMPAYVLDVRRPDLLPSPTIREVLA